MLTFHCFGCLIGILIMVWRTKNKFHMISCSQFWTYSVCMLHRLGISNPSLLIFDKNKVCEILMSPFFNITFKQRNEQNTMILWTPLSSGWWFFLEPPTKKNKGDIWTSPKPWKKTPLDSGFFWNNFPPPPRKIKQGKSLECNFETQKSSKHIAETLRFWKKDSLEGSPRFWFLLPLVGVEFWTNDGTRKKNRGLYKLQVPNKFKHGTCKMVAKGDYPWG